MSAENTIRIPKLFSQNGKVYHFTGDTFMITDDAFKNAKTVIPKGKIMSMRFGIKWISGLYFPVGRHFKIELKLDNGAVVPLKFSSYYGIKKKLYTEKFGELINAVWEHLFYPDLVDIANRFKNGETLYINGVEFNKNGLCWDGQEILTWDKVKLVRFKTYFAIRHTDNALVNKCFYFLTDWDSFLLQQAIQSIISQRTKYADEKYEVNPN